MDQKQNGRINYLCPMHSDIRQPTPGKCPKCGMVLLPEGTRFSLLRHMISNPPHLALMAAVMIAIMAAGDDADALTVCVNDQSHVQRMCCRKLPVGQCRLLALRVVRGGTTFRLQSKAKRTCHGHRLTDADGPDRTSRCFSLGIGLTGRHRARHLRGNLFAFAPRG